MAEDFQKATEATDKIRERFSKYNLTEDPKSVIEYYLELIKLVNEDSLTKQEAAYLIADTMWYRSVANHPDIESIALDAGELEVPEQHMTDDLDLRWNRLVQWVEEERKKYH